MTATTEATTGQRARLRTEYDFELPLGYVDAAGKVHRRGTMRLATARDELAPLIDRRVQENPAYLGVVLLSLVITGLVEQLFAADVAYLQAFYERINNVDAHGPGAGDRLGGILIRPADRLYEEIAYLAYHFHWPPGDLLDLVHRDRLRYVAEVGRINTRTNQGG